MAASIGEDEEGHAAHPYLAGLVLVVAHLLGVGVGLEKLGNFGLRQA